jgi:hypothetical protein
MKATTTPVQRGPSWLTLLVLIVVGASLLGSACGGPPSSGVASLGPRTTTTQASSSPAAGSNATSKYRAALPYVDCMRSHGVPNFPDPSSDGQINVDPSSPQVPGRAEGVRAPGAGQWAQVVGAHDR